MPSKRELAIGLVLCLLVMLFLLCFGRVEALLKTDFFKVKATLGGSSTVSWDEILSVDYLTDFDIGSRQFGFGSFKIEAGTYENEAFGRYKLYSYKKTGSYVVIHYDDGHIVFNLATVEETRGMYDNLCLAIGDE